MKPRWYLRMIPSPLIVAPFETYVAVSAVLTGLAGVLFPQTYRLSPIVSFVGDDVAKMVFGLYLLSGLLIMIGLTSTFRYAKDNGRFIEAAGMFLAAFAVSVFTVFSLIFYASIGQLLGGIFVTLPQLVLVGAFVAWGIQIATLNRVATTQRLISFSKLAEVGRLSEKQYLRVIYGRTPDRGEE